MAATGDEVRKITGTTKLDAELSPFLTAADCIIAELTARGCLANKSPGCIESASNFIAAHFFTSSKVGESSATIIQERFENYAVTLKVGSNEGTGLLSSSYGQTANALLSGCLSMLDKPRAFVQFA